MARLTLPRMAGLLYRVGLSLLALVPFMFLCINQSAEGNQLSDHWSTPIQLSEGMGKSFFPVIIPDAEGGLHVFWEVQDLSGSNTTTTWVDYTYWNGTTWSEPVDVFIGNGPYANAFGAQAVADPNGILQTIWIDDRGLEYAQRSIHSPVSARSWTHRDLLASSLNGAIQAAAITRDAADGLQVVYIQTNATQPGVYYIHSTDGGNQWENPVLISGSKWTTTAMAGNHYLIDLLQSRGVMHVTWQEPDKGIFYARGPVEGGRWSEPVQLIGDNWPSLTAFKDGRLLLLATGTLPGDGICFKLMHISEDEGQTWSFRGKILQPDIKGCLGRINVPVDSSGFPHLVTSAYTNSSGHNEKIWISDWNVDNWSVPQLVNWDGFSYGSLGEQPDMPEATITNGNLLHVVFHVTEGRIWYTQRMLPSPYLDSIQYPTLAAEATLPSEQTPTVHQPTYTPPPTLQIVGRNENPPVQENQITPVYAGVVVGLIPIVIIVGLAVIRKRRIQ